MAEMTFKSNHTSHTSVSVSKANQAEQVSSFILFTFFVLEQKQIKTLSQSVLVLGKTLPTPSKKKKTQKTT